MRTHGTLTKWNQDRGFGFIQPAEGGEAVFVHVSEFPKMGGPPRNGEVISYEIHTGKDGRLRAVGVLRPGRNSASQRVGAAKRAKKPLGLFGAVLGLMAMASIGYYGYRQFKPSAIARSDSLSTSAASAAPSSLFACDGRTQCSQMTSCEEARYFLEHCPNTQMDGNNDGEPCEHQWCN